MRSAAGVNRTDADAGRWPRRLARPWAPTAWGPAIQAVQDPDFVDKLRDIVGLYVDPPAHAVVLSVDEKSQIRALDRTQLGLPLKNGRAGTMTHDYKRNGTTTLFAAMNVVDGTVIGRNMQRHRHQEFIRFLNAVEREVPAGKTIHAILDNHAAHKHAAARGNGSLAIPAGPSTSPQPRLPGSTPSRAFSPP
jgi:DDE superfamily endonuclease